MPDRWLQMQQSWVPVHLKKPEVSEQDLMCGEGLHPPKSRGQADLFGTLRVLSDFIVSGLCFQMLLLCRALWWVCSMANFIFFNFALWSTTETFRKQYRSTALRWLLFKTRVG